MQLKLKSLNIGLINLCTAALSCHTGNCWDKTEHEDEHYQTQQSKLRMFSFFILNFCFTKLARRLKTLNNLQTDGWTLKKTANSKWQEKQIRTSNICQVYMLLVVLRLWAGMLLLNRTYPHVYFKLSVKSLKFYYYKFRKLYCWY